MAGKLGVGRGRGGEAAGGRCKGVSEGDTTVTFALVFRLACAIACKRDMNQMMHATRHTPHVTRHTSHVTHHMPHVTRHTLTNARDKYLCSGHENDDCAADGSPK
jgi:hypothetical protein